MKLGVFTVPLGGKSVEETFAYLSSRGVTALEIGAGGYPGDDHLKPLEIANDPAKAEEYKSLLKKYNLELSAISIHSNHVHPNKDVAAKAATDFTNACKAAKALGVDTIVTFAGCPGDSEGAKYPNWVTVAWPDDNAKILEYQWNEVLIPFWKKAVEEAASYGVTKIAIEMHPGFCVYNPASLLKLREAVGPAIGANVDPSHLYWQGINPADAIKHLAGTIYHFHAKDTKIDTMNTRINGVLDPKSFEDMVGRSWVFRTVGYGHDQIDWKETMSALQVSGYDGIVSIEHEDGLMSIEEGLNKAIEFLKDVMIFEQPAAKWWA